MNHATHTPETQLAAVVDERLCETVALLPLYAQYDAEEDSIIRRLFDAVRTLAHQPSRLLVLADELETAWLRADARADQHIEATAAEMVRLARESRRLSALTTTAASVRG